MRLYNHFYLEASGCSAIMHFYLEGPNVQGGFKGLEVPEIIAVSQEMCFCWINSKLFQR